MTNLALVAQKRREFSECFRWCDKALRCALALPLRQPLSVCGQARAGVLPLAP